MRMFPSRQRFWTALVVVSYWCALQVAPASAGLAPSRVTGLTTIASTRDADLAAVQRALENRLVVQKLRDYGVTAEQAQLRVASLSDADLHTLASASKGLPSGGDGLGTIIALLVIALLVIVILKIMNKQIIVR